jgi:zinc protease
MPRPIARLARLGLCAIIGILAMTSTTPASAAESAASESAKAHKRASYFQLDNGMEVVVIPDHRAPIVTHMVWYKVGGADEPPGSSGIAHFLEHLMFKGTEKIGNGEFSKIIARNGGRDNAFTTQDATTYFQKVAKDRLPLVMEMEADRMVNLRLDEKEVLTERKVILEERRSRVDNDPGSILQEQMFATLYLAHPYRVPVIGWENEIRALTREDAMAFYKRFYEPDNAILVVAGDVEPEEALQLAREKYGRIPRSGGVTHRRTQEPEPQAPRKVILKDARAGKATLQRIYLAPSASTAAPREAEALELIAHILGSNTTGKLYRKLVIEEKKAASAAGWYGAVARDSGRFGVYAVAAGDEKLDAIEASMDTVIDGIRQNGVTEKELDRARNTIIADLVYETDNVGALARIYGWSLATGLKIEDVESEADRLAAVTVDDVKAAARKYLDQKRSVTGYLIPEHKTMTANAGPTRLPDPSGVLH